MLFPLTQAVETVPNYPDETRRGADGVPGPGGFGHQPECVNCQKPGETIVTKDKPTRKVIRVGPLKGLTSLVQ